MNFHLNDIESRFKGYPDFKLLSITVDPEKDSVQALATYQKEHVTEKVSGFLLQGRRSRFMIWQKACS